ncbi:MAG: C39 family peptidase [bacterium]
MNFRKISKIKILTIIIIVLFIPFKPVYSDTLDRINSEISKKQQLSKELEARAKKYNTLISQKKKEVESLTNQIEIMEAEISEMEANIDLTTNQIEILTIETNDLSAEIGVKEAEISENKKYLSQSLKKIYEYDNTEMFSTLLNNNTLSDFLNQVEYLKNLQGDLKSSIEKLKDKRQELQTSKQTVEDKKSATVVLKQQQEYQKSVLNEQKRSKDGLLFITKGQEKEYKNLLTEVDKQKSEILGDLEELEKQKSEELAKAKSRQLSPTSGVASTSWYFRQNDARWKNTTIGHSRSTLGRYGCAVSSVAMIAKYNGVDTNPGILAKQPIFYKDLIKWPQELGTIELIYNKSRSLVDWNRVDEELSLGYPVIVFIKRTNGTGGHYVVVAGKDKSNGKYVVHDPYFGPNIYLDSSRENISILYGGCGTQVDQLIIYHKK